jgi:hypothetical protein
MKTLLRQVSTGLFFGGPSCWCRDANAGRNFKSIDRALSFIRDFHLQDVEIVFAFNDSAEVKPAPLEKVAVGFTEER